MSRGPAHRVGKQSVIGAEGLERALRTHEVDAIVGDHDIMFVRLKQAENNLEHSRDQLRALTAHLMVVRDGERAAIARELHDEFGQVLTSLQLGLAWLARSVTPDQKPLLAKIGSLSDSTTGMIRSVRNITVELRLGTLEELGLVKTLKAKTREFEASAGIPCRFRTNAAGARFNREAAGAVYRIVQAALTNVARHARASNVWVALMKSTRDLTVTVRDDGKGISATRIGSPLSLGITGMRERTLALGGTFTLANSRGKGTLLTARIPLARVATGPANQTIRARRPERPRRTPSRP